MPASSTGKRPEELPRLKAIKISRKKKRQRKGQSSGFAHKLKVVHFKFILILKSSTALYQSVSSHRKI